MNSSFIIILYNTNTSIFYPNLIQITINSLLKRRMVFLLVSGLPLQKQKIILNKISKVLMIDLDI